MRKRANLSSLLDPRAIAVIGAPPTPGRVGHILLEGLLRSGIPLYPVHPDAREVAGLPTLPDVESLPDNVDVAVITLRADRAVEAAEACAARGIPHLIPVAGGFGEAGDAGKALEARLRAIPEHRATRILGPNTLGIFLPHKNLDTLFVDHGDKALAAGGGVAFITQSGSVGVEALGLAAGIGFGLRAFVGLGNKCDLDELDFLHHFAADPGTTCLAFYLESLDTGRTFLQAAAEVSPSKPVVVLKAGKTATGARAAASHTGRLAGSDRVVDGALRQFGILRVFDDEELSDAARTLALVPPPGGNRVAIVSPAGGYGVMGADHIESRHRGTPLTMATLAGRTRARIRAEAPPFASVANPVDLTAGADNAMFAAALDALLEDDGVDIVLCVAFFAPPAVTDGLITEVAKRAAAEVKPILVFSSNGPNTDRYLRRFHDAGVAGFPSISRAVRAARFLVERGELLKAMRGGG